MSKKEPTGRLARWSLFLQQFDITIRYRPGKRHQNADCLSRIPIYAIIKNDLFVEDWITAQQNDEFCKTVLKVKGQPGTAERQLTENDEFTVLENGLIATADGRIVVPAILQTELLELYHDHKLGGHFGIDKTVSRIKVKYFWLKMIRDIKHHIQNCIKCAKRKTTRTTKAPLQPIPTTDYVWQRVAMDIMGPIPESHKGNKYILVILEYATKYVIAVPCKEISAKTIARKFIKHVINNEGIPSEILTDQGTNFQSATMKELCHQLGIKRLRTTVYHPQTDGAVEKFNRTLGDMLTMHFADNPADWDSYLDYCVGTYNRTPHTSTKDTPFYLLKGRDALEPTDVRPPMRNRWLKNEANIFAQQWHEALDRAKARLM